MRGALGLALVAAQLGIVLASQSTDCCRSLYFAWAPNDYSIEYRIAASVNGRALSGPEILDRYQLPQAGFYENPLERLKGYLQRRELLYAGNDRVDLTLRYELNGRETTEWTWSK